MSIRGLVGLVLLVGFGVSASDVCAEGVETPRPGATFPGLETLVVDGAESVHFCVDGPSGYGWFVVDYAGASENDLKLGRFVFSSGSKPAVAFLLRYNDVVGMNAVSGPDVTYGPVVRFSVHYLAERHRKAIAIPPSRAKRLLPVDGLSYPLFVTDRFQTASTAGLSPNSELLLRDRRTVPAFSAPETGTVTCSRL